MRPADPRPVMRSIHLLPEGRAFRGLGAQVVAIAPDGRYFIYSGTGGLYVRSMDALEDRLIPGTTDSGSREVIVSPDGQSVAFFQPSSAGGGELFRMPVAGGATVKLTNTNVAFGGTWGEDGTILYAQPGGIWEVSQNGGEPRQVITLRSDELAFHPQRLPGGDWILFTATRTQGGSRWDMADIVVESVASGERRVLRQGGSDGRYLPTGHLVYAYQDVLFATAFDVDRLEVTGEAVPIVPGVRRVEAPGGNTGAAFFAASTNGTLVYVQGTFSAGSTGLAWVERDGTRTALNLPQGRYAHPRLSPDGKWLTVERQSGATVDIWIYETSGATEMRRLTNGGNNRYPVWSRDGAYVAFQSDREGNPGIFRQKFDGTGSAERLTTPDGKRSHVPEDWSPKEDLLAFSILDGTTSGTTHAELWLWSQSDRKATRFGTMQSANPFDAVFSPDGRWLAYSQRNLANNVLTYVHSVASPEVRFQVGRDEDAVHHPLWSPNGRQLIYFPGGGAAVAVDVRTAPSFGFGRPTALPGDGLPVNVSPGSLLNHDVHPDGRFITVADVESANAGARNRNAIVIVQNWFEELKRRVPR
jgi:serine/threonine-protein kinase